MLAEMPFYKITVSALVKRAGISPNTFYYHYEDIYDLLENGSRCGWNDSLQRMTGGKMPKYSWRLVSGMKSWSDIF